MNKFIKIFTFLFVCFLILILFGVLIYILYSSILAFSTYGWKIITGNFFNLSNNQVSFWFPFVGTLITTTLALIIAYPLAIHTVVFIKFKIRLKYRRFFKIIIEILSGIPSVIFGLFALQSLKSLSQLFAFSPYSLFNASIMLAFMILPTIFVFAYNALEHIDPNILANSLALGINKNKAIYKLCKKAAKRGIIVGVILAIGRSIGEAMALSMLLQTENEYIVLSQNPNLFQLFNASFKTVSVVISTNLFTENATDQSRSLLFAFGFILFLLILFFNLIIAYILKQKRTNKVGFFTFMHTKYQNVIWSFLNLTTNYKHKKRKEKEKKWVFYSFYKNSVEVLSASLCFGFLFWLIFDVVTKGLTAWTTNTSSIFSYGQNTTGQAFFNTFLIVIVALLVSFPIALFSAIYLQEFSQKQRYKKIINFFLDSLNSTPSILLGIFGLLFFINTLGLTNTGYRGFSLLAGALSIGIVILPFFTRSIQEALLQVPQEIRNNGLALGINHLQVVFKLVIPIAFRTILSSIILVISRILSETAPLYLTAGLTGGRQIALTNPGQTLTTRIYAQLENTNINQGLNIMYENAVLNLLLIFSLIFISYYLIPYWKNIKKLPYKYVWRVQEIWQKKR